MTGCAVCPEKMSERTFEKTFEKTLEKTLFEKTLFEKLQSDSRRQISTFQDEISPEDGQNGWK